MSSDESSPESASNKALEQTNDTSEALRNCAAECRRLRRELEEANARAKQAMDETQQVVYAVGHDLRTSLRNIMGYSQLLQRGPRSEEETREFLGFVVGGAQEMNRFLDEILKFSRAGNSHRPTPIDLGMVAQIALLQLDKQIRELGVKVQLGELPEAVVDESQFAQVFEQLFINSIVYRGSEPPSIDVSAEEGTEAHTISVRDNGIGFKPEYTEAIFQPFKRLHGKEKPGIGLGLAICRKILRRRGGTIWAESDGENGATFKFTIPHDYQSN